MGRRRVGDRLYRRHGFALADRDRTGELLRAYWTIPERQIETSVVLERITPASSSSDESTGASTSPP